MTWHVAACSRPPPPAIEPGYICVAQRPLGQWWGYSRVLPTTARCDRRSVISQRETRSFKPAMANRKCSHVVICRQLCLYHLCLCDLCWCHLCLCCCLMQAIDKGHLANPDVDRIIVPRYDDTIIDVYGASTCMGLWTGWVGGTHEWWYMGLWTGWVGGSHGWWYMSCYSSIWP